MKKKILTILIILCMVIGLGAFAPTYAFADEFLVSDSYFYFENPTFVYASEEVTISSENAVYVISDGKVTTYDKKADKAIFENGILAVLDGGNLFVNEELVCSNVLDFALKNGRLVFVDGNAIHVRTDALVNQMKTISAVGFSSVAISNNGAYLKADMGAYDNVYFLQNNSETPTLYTEYAKKFDYLIFDTKLWGATENTLYDFTQKQVVSPYANAVSIYNDSVYYLADGCLYKDNEYMIGAGQDFSFPTKITSNTDGIYVVDQNGITTLTYEDKYVKKATSNNKAQNVALSQIPNTQTYYTIDSDVYLEDTIIYSEEDNVVDLAVDGNGNVYYTTKTQTYKNGEIVFEVGGQLAIAPARQDVYNLTDGKIFKNGEALIEEVSAKAFDVDSSGNVFLLTAKEVVKVDTNGEKTTIEHSLFEAVDVAISYEKNSLGKIMLVDKKAHNVTFVGEMQATIPSFSFENNVDGEVIRTTINSTTVFANVNKTEIITTLPASSLLVCSVYDLECNDFLAYVSFKNGNEMAVGFVQKSDLSDAIKGKTPRYKQAKTYYDNVMIHSHPYSLQEGVNTVICIVENKDSSLNLLGKYTIFEEDWYKAEYNGNVGYVHASQIQLGDYNPTIRPSVNATLTYTCYVFVNESGEYVLGDAIIESGTDVEVIGVFDSNTEYTQIKYYDSEAGGTRTCYVKTDAIKYNHVTFEQQFALIAVLIISATLVLAIIIFVKHKHKTK